MQGNEKQDVNARPSGSEQGGSSGTPHLSAKLRNKIDKLAKWQVDPSLIEFLKDTRELHGGHATVARATLYLTFNPWSRSNSINQDVAIKKLRIWNKDDQQRVLELALREAGFLVELSHTNIIKLVGFVKDLTNHIIWLIFPWEARGNLKEFAAAIDWEIPERISLINDVATGVEYLHTRNPPICHGDLKSVNVLVNSRCRAIITDFGSARRIKARAPNTQTSQSENGALPELVLKTTICETTNTITLTGNKYTLRWAAPELLMDDEPGLWSDVWSLGWICYEVMTNSIPFEDVENDFMVIERVIRGDLPSVSHDNRMALVRALHLLMTECWSIDPSERPSAEDCRSSMNQMPKIIPERLQTSGGGIPDDRDLRRLVAQGAIHNDYTKALSLLNEALTTSTDTGNDEVKALALQSLAEKHMLQSKYSDAASCYSEALKLLSDKEERRKALMGLADASRSLKEYSKASASYFQAMEIDTDSANSKRGADALLRFIGLK
ncbi:hypothetical protein M407DRAFT_27175 [Tulasnella calospora MUT 4182]|uniref:Protein kinase domain-containing protein n=1 Tax=Tulasnella calospora MUT 4182 TaxID=1051891 RepID=A0A0C3LPM4_9AGAM|nr:hypothetical protein M407DRAFT_27175 [Tulasnella calospora MUT 4182]